MKEKDYNRNQTNGQFAFLELLTEPKTQTRNISSVGCKNICVPGWVQLGARVWPECQSSKLHAASSPRDRASLPPKASASMYI